MVRSTEIYVETRQLIDTRCEAPEYVGYFGASHLKERHSQEVNCLTQSHSPIFIAFPVFIRSLPIVTSHT